MFGHMVFHVLKDIAGQTSGIGPDNPRTKQNESDGLPRVFFLENGTGGVQHCGPRVACVFFSVAEKDGGGGST